MRRFFIIGAILAVTVLFALPTNARARDLVVQTKQNAQTGKIKEVFSVSDENGPRAKEERISWDLFMERYGESARYVDEIKIFRFKKPNPGNCTTYCSGGYCDTFCW